MNRRDFLKQTAFAATGLLLSTALRFDGKSLVGGDDPKVFTGLDKFGRLLKLAREGNWRALPIGEIIGKAGMALRGTPYVGGTLELYDDREVCSVNLLGLDCLTFFENVLGFARMLKKKKVSPDDLLHEIAFMRYRGGQLGDYTSRLHYTTDWFDDNERKGVVKVITKDLPGAQRLMRPVNFMSSHPESYRQLKANSKLAPMMADIEMEINHRETHYLPKEKIEAALSRLQTGDIIGITTNLDGLDCSHTGLGYRDEKGGLRLLHASTTKKEVVLDEELSVYLARGVKHTGIMVARPLEVMPQKR